MWKRLADWLLPTAEKPPVRHRARFSRTRGQLEPLESRMVLSASFAELPAEVQTSAAGAWASVDDEIVRPSLFSVEINSIPHGSTAPIAALGGWHDEYGGLERSLWEGPPLAPNALRPQGPFYVVTIVAIYVPTNAAGTNQFQSSSASEPAPPEIPRPLAATSLLGNSHDEPPPQSLLFARSPVDSIGSFASLLATQDVTTVSATSRSTASEDARDSVFRDYSARLLLLTGADEWRDRELGRFRDELESSVDREHEDIAEFTGFGFHDEVAASLDALERELAAVDAVLSELHDIDSRAIEPASDPERGNQRPESTNFLNTSERPLPTSDPEIVASTNDDLAAGGMVLLEPSGDPNLSACDLTALITGRFEDAGEAPPGLEVSMGVYQAFDVGGIEQQPSASSSTSTSPSAAMASPGASEVGGSRRESKQAS